MLRSLGFVAAFAAAGSVAAAPAPLAEDAKAFGAREAAFAADLSPSGNRLVVLTAAQGHATAIKIVDLANAQTKVIGASSGEPEVLDWCRFASDSQLVCNYDANLDMGGIIVGFSRLATLDSDGKSVKALGQTPTAYDAYLRQNDGAILDWLPGEDGAVLMARSYVPQAGMTGSNIVRNDQGLGVDRVELRSLRTTRIEPPRRDVDGYMTDGRGNVRLRIDVEAQNSSQQMTGLVHYAYRTAGSKDWRPLGTYNSISGDGIRPLAVEADSNTLYYLQKLNGRNALYRMTLDGSNATALVAKNDRVDIDEVIRAGRGRKVIGYSFAEDSRRVVYFDPDYARLQASLARALPNSPLIDFVSWSADGQKMIIFAGSDVSPGTYYFLDRTTKKMEPLLDVRPQLSGRAMAPVKAITFRARDGATLPAYVTIPAGSSGKDMPAVVLPHGGPASRDEWGFDWLPQFLAARGYVVIQPQYRGSAGFGDDFFDGNGFRNWQTSIADIADSARYLVSQGIADARRMAIVGWSYGGYAALQSAAVEPALFKAVVAIAPVTDLSLLKSDATDFTNANLVRDFVGSGPNAKTGSPLRNAGAIKVPVLLAHGDLDANVGIAHSVRMEGALKAANMPVELLRYKALDHQLDDNAARTEMLTRIGALLERTIGH